MSRVRRPWSRHRFPGGWSPRPIKRGDRIGKGARLYVIDTTKAEAEVARAAASLVDPQARHNNLLTGKRTEEQDIVRAQRRQIEASLVAAEAELGRQSDLVAKNFVFRHSYDQAFAQVAELRAQGGGSRGQGAGRRSRRTARDRCRPSALVEQQYALFVRARTQLAELTPIAPEPALVEDTFFHVGNGWRPAARWSPCCPTTASSCASSCPRPSWRSARSGEARPFCCDG